MHVTLYCPDCRRGFPALPHTPAGEALDRLAEEGPWSALGDGETFEDSLAAALGDGPACCPRCGASATVDEKSLGRVTMQMLTTW